MNEKKAVEEQTDVNIVRDLKKRKDRKVVKAIKGARQDQNRLDWQTVMQKQSTAFSSETTTPTEPGIGLKSRLNNITKDKLVLMKK